MHKFKRIAFSITLFLILLPMPSFLNADSFSLYSEVSSYKEGTSFFFPGFNLEYKLAEDYKIQFHYVLERLLIQNKFYNFIINGLHLFTGLETEISAAQNLAHKIREGKKSPEESFNASFIRLHADLIWKKTSDYQFKLNTGIYSYFFKRLKETDISFILPYDFLQIRHSLIFSKNGKFYSSKNNSLKKSKNSLSYNFYLNLSIYYRNKDRDWGNSLIPDNLHDEKEPAYTAQASLRLNYKFSNSLSFILRTSGGTGHNLDDINRFKLGGDTQYYTKRISGSLFYEFFTSQYFLINIDANLHFNKKNKLYILYDALYLPEGKIIEGTGIGMRLSLTRGLSLEVRTSYLLKGIRSKIDERFKFFIGSIYRF